MPMLIRPEKPFLRESKCSWIADGLVCGCCPINTKSNPIEVLAIGEHRSDFACVVKPPEEAAVLLIPHHVLEKIDAVLHNRHKVVFHLRLAQHHLRRDPRHPSLKDRELAIAWRPLPVAREMRVETTVLMIY